MKRCRNCKKYLSNEWHHNLCRKCRRAIKKVTENVVIYKKFDPQKVDWSKTLTNKKIWRLNGKYFCVDKDFNSICNECIAWIQERAMV